MAMGTHKRIHPTTTKKCQRQFSNKQNLTNFIEKQFSEKFTVYIRSLQSFSSWSDWFEKHFPRSALLFFLLKKGEEEEKKPNNDGCSLHDVENILLYHDFFLTKTNRWIERTFWIIKGHCLSISNDIIYHFVSIKNGTHNNNNNKREENVFICYMCSKRTEQTVMNLRMTQLNESFIFFSFFKCTDWVCVCVYVCVYVPRYYQIKVMVNLIQHIFDIHCATLKIIIYY